MMTETVSLLMSTYRGERAERLARSLEMTYAQTMIPDQVVLVVDGPIGDDQEQVIAKYREDNRISNLCVVRSESSLGLAGAMNHGLKHCTSGWIMRMDSDDESVVERTAIQMTYLKNHPEVDLVGGWAEEFFDDQPDVTRIKSSPVTHQALTQALKWRNVLVHPSIVVRATSLERVEGYRTTYPYLEDWDLFIRLILAGAKIAVIPKVLVRVRVGRDQAARRGGLRYVFNETRFRTFCWTSGFINLRQYAVSTAAYIAFRLAGARVRNRLYSTVRKVSENA